MIIHLDFCFQCWCKHNSETTGSTIDLSNEIQCIRTYIYTTMIWLHILEMEILFYIFLNQVNQGTLNTSVKWEGGDLAKYLFQKESTMVGCFVFLLLCALSFEAMPEYRAILHKSRNNKTFPSCCTAPYVTFFHYHVFRFLQSKPN